LLPQGIVLFHHSIRGALEVFTPEAAALLLLLPCLLLPQGIM
jgi:hypothetical protein